MFLFLFTSAHDYKLCRIGDKFLHISKNYPLIKNITPSQYEQRIVGGLKYTKNDNKKKHSNSFTQLGTNSLIEVKTRPELKPRRTALFHKVFSFLYCISDIIIRIFLRLWHRTCKTRPFQSLWPRTCKTRHFKSALRIKTLKNSPESYGIQFFILCLSYCYPISQKK